MSMSKIQQFNEILELSDIKPDVSSSGIYFPVSVEHTNLNKYDGDARSFGYHFDDGQCTVVTYEQVVGVLAEDTISLFEECDAIKKFMKKPHHSMLDIVGNGSKCDTGSAELLIRYDSEYFYKDDEGYFFQTTYFDYGVPQRVSDETAEIYLEVNKEYQRQVKSYNNIMKEALANLDLLSSTVEL